MLIEWCISFLLINIKEVGQEVDPNPDGGTVYGDIRKCKIGNLEQRSKNIEDWMRSIKEVKAHIGLYSQLGRIRCFALSVVPLYRHFFDGLSLCVLVMASRISSVQLPDVVHLFYLAPISHFHI
jgi:hypothetical protein